MYAKITILGRVGQDAECKADNRPVNFSVAVNKNFRKDGEWKSETTWHDVIVWGKDEYKQSLLKRLGKGAIVFVEGEPIIETWEDSESGKKMKAPKINASLVRVVHKADNDGAPASDSPMGGASDGGGDEDDGLPF